MQISLTTYSPIQIINVVNRNIQNILRFDSVDPKTVKNKNVILQIYLKYSKYLQVFST